MCIRKDGGAKIGQYQTLRHQRFSQRCPRSYPTPSNPFSAVVLLSPMLGHPRSRVIRPTCTGPVWACVPGPITKHEPCQTLCTPAMVEHYRERHECLPVSATIENEADAYVILPMTSGAKRLRLSWNLVGTHWLPDPSPTATTTHTPSHRI